VLLLRSQRPTVCIGLLSKANCSNVVSGRAVSVAFNPYYCECESPSCSVCVENHPIGGTSAPRPTSCRIPHGTVDQLSKSLVIYNQYLAFDEYHGWRVASRITFSVLRCGTSLVGFKHAISHGDVTFQKDA
jgi:hypothetical protein